MQTRVIQSLVGLVIGVVLVFVVFGVAPIKYQDMKLEKEEQETSEELAVSAEKAQTFIRRFAPLDYGMNPYDVRDLFGQPRITSSGVWYYDLRYFTQEDMQRVDYVKRCCIVFQGEAVDGWEIVDLKVGSAELDDEPCRQFLYQLDQEDGL